MPPQYRSLYYLSNSKGVTVYNPKNILIGYTTGYNARPTGLPDSLGSIEVDTITNGPMWIEGYGLRVMGMGIQWRVLK